MRDAVVAALSLNIFHDHADRVAMTNIAQMVNVLQAMILTDGPDMVLTPTYHVFEMYKPFQGAMALPVSYDAPDYSFGEYTIPAISLSAAQTPDGKLVVALVNSDAKAAHAVDISAFGVSGFTGRILTADAMDAHNTFAAPKAVTPSPFNVEGGVANLPPHSVVVLTEGE